MTMTPVRHLRCLSCHLIRTLTATAALTALAAGTTSPAAGQERRFEITPYYGHSFLGGFEIEDREIRRPDLETANSSVHGLIVGFPIRRNFHLELFINGQDTRFRVSQETPQATAYLDSVEVTSSHVGAAWTYPIGQVRPFASFSAGITRLAPESDLLPETQTRFSVGIGGGTKIFFTDHLGLRLEARLLVPTTDEEDICCPRLLPRRRSQRFAQGIVSAGLTYAF